MITAFTFLLVTAVDSGRVDLSTITGRIVYLPFLTEQRRHRLEQGLQAAAKFPPIELRSLICSYLSGGDFALKEKDPRFDLHGRIITVAVLNRLLFYNYLKHKKDFYASIYGRYPWTIEAGNLHLESPYFYNDPRQNPLRPINEFDHWTLVRALGGGLAELGL